MVLETRNLSDLKPAKYNPRKTLTPEDAEFQKIKRSIEQFGYVDPIIINKDGTIIGGHQRFNVLKELGFTEIDVVVVDLNKNDEKALNIALNKITGEWDEKALRDLLVELDISEYDITFTGFDQKEVEELIELVDFEAEVSQDNFNSEKEMSDSSNEPPIIRSGEVWQLGKHRLMCGDCTNIDDMKKLLGGEMMDLIVTDPPYNVNYKDHVESLLDFRVNGNSGMEIKNDVMNEDAFAVFLQKSFENTNAFMRDGAAIYVFHADMHGLTFRKAFLDSGFKLSEILIWEKNKFSIGKNDYHWRHEPILYGWKEGAGHYFVDDRTQDTVILDDEIDFDSMKKSELIEYIHQNLRCVYDKSTVSYEKSPRSNSLHPTMKPLELLGKFIKNSSKREWNVGDFFGGSGSTLMACEQLDRNAFVMEIDEHYASVIIKRWEAFTGEKAMKMEG